MRTDVIIAHVYAQEHRTYTDHQVRNSLYKEKYTQKVVENHPTEQDPVARQSFRDLLKPPHLGGQFTSRQLLFVDESHMNLEACYRKYGRSPVNKPAWRRRPATFHGERSTSVIASMSIRGIESATNLPINNADTFLNVLEFDILLVMNPYPLEKSVLILDNAAVHDKVRIYALCARFGVIVLFLPTYSFDYNPIELIFHLAKNHIRQHEGIDAAHNPISLALNRALYASCSVENACALFQHCFIHVSANDQIWANT